MSLSENAFPPITPTTVKGMGPMRMRCPTGSTPGPNSVSATVKYATVVTTGGQFGLLACYGDDETTKIVADALGVTKAAWPMMQSLLIGSMAGKKSSGSWPSLPAMGALRGVREPRKLDVVEIPSPPPQDPIVLPPRDGRAHQRGQTYQQLTPRHVK